METVLLLDDDSMLLKLLESVLSEHYSVFKVESAEQALRVFNEHRQYVDILIADLSLPKSSGIHVALLLRSVLPDLPIILTSGYPLNSWSERDSEDLSRLGANSVLVLQKPFGLQLLLTTIRALIEGPRPELATTTVKVESQ